MLFGPTSWAPNILLTPTFQISTVYQAHANQVLTLSRLKGTAITSNLARFSSNNNQSVLIPKAMDVQLKPHSPRY